MTTGSVSDAGVPIAFGGRRGGRPTRDRVVTRQYGSAEPHHNIDARQFSHVSVPHGRVRAKNRA
jgi:hypothetical protein